VLQIQTRGNVSKIPCSRVREYVAGVGSIGVIRWDGSAPEWVGLSTRSLALGSLLPVENLSNLPMLRALERESR